MLLCCAVAPDLRQYKIETIYHQPFYYNMEDDRLQRVEQHFLMVFKQNKQRSGYGLTKIRKDYNNWLFNYKSIRDDITDEEMKIVLEYIGIQPSPINDLCYMCHFYPIQFR